MAATTQVHTENTAQQGVAHLPRRILRIDEVCRLTGFCRAWLYALSKQNKFPKARKIGLRAVGWDSLQVEAWIRDRLEGRV